ncbi:hypothetical protein AOR01nite_26290 [Acetobacter orleanensis]|uniref:Uncharacterized protein n=2 Tax=Acetobacter orleanensis TaxID=104099 RepID=A0A4Y3TQT7_9PROT|nr:hypothetical protein AOR01nite_26290 [Acetobacter orleanensis]
MSLLILTMKETPQMNAPQNTRKKRSDAGKPQGPRTPRKASPITHMDNGTALIALTGRHGTGRHLRVSKTDLPDLMIFTDNGTRLHVIDNGSGQVKIQIGGRKAKAWKHSTNPSDLVTAARFLVGETHGGRRIRFKDRNAFNLTRDNLEVLVPAIEETFTIDWQKAVAARQTKMQSCLERQTNQ